MSSVSERQVEAASSISTAKRTQTACTLPARFSATAFFSNDARHGTANDTDAGHASDGALGIAVTMLAGVGPGGSLWTHKGKK